MFIITVVSITKSLLGIKQEFYKNGKYLAATEVNPMCLSAKAISSFHLTQKQYLSVIVGAYTVFIVVKYSAKKMRHLESVLDLLIFYAETGFKLCESVPW